MSQKTLIPIARPAIGQREIEYLEDCVYSGRIGSGGAYVEMFERRFSRWLGAQHAVATSSGAAALHLALAALGVRRGDEVLVPALAQIAAANAVTYTGARPVFVDAARESWTLDPDAVTEKIGPRTKGIIAVHLYGHPVDLDPINRLAARHELFVVESASDALGTMCRGERVGTLSTAACFSFGPGKPLTTGGGGMLSTDNEELAVRASFLAVQGRVSKREHLHSWIGFDYKMSNLHAALGAAQMDELDMRTTLYRDVGMRYRELLGGIPGLTVGPETPWGTPSFGRVALLVGPEFPMSKGELERRLRREGVETEPFYFPIHLQVPYVKCRGKKLPVAEDLYERGLLLPTSALLANEDLLRVAGAVRRIHAEGAHEQGKARRKAPGAAR